MVVFSMGMYMVECIAHSESTIAPFARFKIELMKTFVRQPQCLAYNMMTAPKTLDIIPDEGHFMYNEQKGNANTWLFDKLLHIKKQVKKT